MFSLGQDVRAPQGNLLVRFGFEKSSSPAAPGVSSTYTLSLGGDECLALTSDGVCLRCAARDLRLDRGPMLPQLKALSVEQLKRLLAWLAEYETWVACTCGDQYRARSLAARSRAPRVAPSEMTAAYRHLIQELERMS